MRQIMTYRDAVAVLGGPSGLTNVLDRTSSIALFGLGAIDLFDARAEAVRLGDAFLRGLRDKMKGLSRHDATRRLAAAHSVIVVAAFLDALREVDVLRELSREDQRRITGTGDFGPHLIDFGAPAPSPAVPFEVLLDQLGRGYEVTTRTLVEHLSGLARWDTWDETTRARLTRDLPVRALRRYEELLRRLAADFPEVACWFDRLDHQATRAEIRNLAHGLAGVQEQLAAIPSTRGPSERLAALIRSNGATLGRPIMTTTRTPSGMSIPTLDRGYVDPAYRLLAPGWQHPVLPPEDGWARLPLRSDLGAFLAAHLLLPQAVEAPLLVLGQPGAGKSVLTRMLAARLPAAEFLPLRVELRGVPADGDVLAQVEHGIRTALDEPMSWPDFVHAAAGALPVVLLDGFDELLQATGVSQSDYLERVARFQRDQAEKGRPAVVVVTSRSAVANRARLPAGSYVVRLEPFDGDRIGRWVATWNDANLGYFRARGLRPLPVDRVRSVPKLAEQPLLLLMLALYDADANALRDLPGLPGDLHEAELYERLLHDFAVREIGKTRPHLEGGELERAVEDELLRLSITAFAMFNRGLQWIAEPDLEADLEALLPGEGRRPRGLRRALTRAEDVIGGFFFVHTTQALRDAERLKTYEFLHATFGEYLVARLVVRELTDLAEELASAASRRRFARPDDAYLHALLSFAGLTVRASVVDFLRHRLVQDVPPERRAALTRHLCELFSEALHERPGSAHDAYQPARLELTARCAVYSANLLLLAVLSSDEPVTGAELFRVGHPVAANERWRRIARLWHSQLSREEWESLTHTLWVRHVLDGGTRTMRVAFDRDPVLDSQDLAFFTWPDRGPDDGRHRLRARGLVWMREISFRDDTTLGHLFTNLLPYVREIDTDLSAHPGTQVADLLALLLAAEPDPDAYRAALLHAPTRAYRNRVLRQLESDAPAMLTDDLLELLRLASRRRFGGLRLLRLLRALETRPDADREGVGELIRLLSRQTQDQPGLGPLADPEVAPVRPGDVPGDRQP
ncbi:hypothetical protein FAF44_42790 [Nonomuraea sp. MG754425]|uniref:NACHT domain-containing protein n=1 Tax=Nonomuraea sp. MG754425 TaxID=2570319 RepID=UPI001F3950D7|nr:ATP-binding protein [Nonomuraea sp. MG754425]MCF6475053.1 hypothetical protein [Nonomuraea sp. MG754425]